MGLSGSHLSISKVHQKPHHGRVQIHDGVVSQEAKRCDALLASYSLLAISPIGQGPPVPTRLVVLVIRTSKASSSSALPCVVEAAKGPLPKVAPTVNPNPLVPSSNRNLFVTCNPLLKKELAAVLQA